MFCCRTLPVLVHTQGKSLHKVIRQLHVSASPAYFTTSVKDSSCINSLLGGDLSRRTYEGGTPHGQQCTEKAIYNKVLRRQTRQSAPLASKAFSTGPQMRSYVLNWVNESLAPNKTQTAPPQINTSFQPLPRQWKYRMCNLPWSQTNVPASLPD